MASDHRLREQHSNGVLLAACGIGLGLGAMALLARKRNAPTVAAPPPPRALPPPARPAASRSLTVRRGHAHSVEAARGLNRASGMLAFSVLFDSALEHYRADFFNPAMYAPIAASSLSLLASLHGTADVREGAHRGRHAILVVAALTGLAGGAFHTWNVGKREGGFGFQNLFYAAPLGAPYALILSGILGAAAEWVRDAERNDPKIFGIEADRILSAVTSAGLLGTIGEAGLLHFRGAFQNPAMVIPVTLPPVAAVLLAKAAIGPKQHDVSYRWTRRWLGATALMGIAGVVFHSYGVARMMGGWRNWKQNVIDGPPLPAPPSFTGLALAGLAAIRLKRNAGRE